MEGGGGVCLAVAARRSGIGPTDPPTRQPKEWGGGTEKNIAPASLEGEECCKDE